MFVLGFFALALAMYLIDSGIKNRSPFGTLRDIISDPKNARDTLTASAQISKNTRNVMLGNTGPGTLASVNDPLIGSILAYAQAQVGKRYVWGGIGPDGYDCSGLIWAAYRQAGVPIPRTTVGMLASGTKITKDQLQPGDLVFPYPGHVFLYAGGGRTIEAANPSDGILNGTVYKFWTARRYI